VRAIQRDRYAGVESPTPVRTNADADGKLLESVATPDDAGRAILSDALDKFKLSARGYHRILRVARTCADMDGSETVGQVHVAEAISFRRNMPGSM
ncbi:MAG: ATP-binding protein, partial [Rhodospirillales bacterium]|nr:ATP-binding protein [Rhodospirillales bacterium]